MLSRIIQNRREIVKRRTRRERLTHFGLVSAVAGRSVSEGCDLGTIGGNARFQTGSEEMDSRDAVATVRHAIAELFGETVERQILERVCMGGERYSTVAASLDLTENATRTRACRAKKKLRDFLSNWYENNWG